MVAIDASCIILISLAGQNATGLPVGEAERGGVGS